MSFYIGIDIGTSKISLVLIESQTGQIKVKIVLPNNSQVIFKEENKQSWAEQNPFKIRQIVLSGLKRLILSLKSDNRKQIRGIGLTGQMHGLILVDKKLNPLSNLITWQDGRAEQAYPGSKISYVERMKELIGKELILDTGVILSTGYLGATLFWLKENKQLAGSRFRVTFIHNYLASFLTGHNVFVDPSDGGSSGIFDIRNGKWHKDIIRRLGINGELFPPVIESGEPLGKIKSSLAKDLGLNKRILIFSPFGDNQASFLGSVKHPKETILVNLGTGGQISMLNQKFINLKNLETRYLPIKKFLLVGATLCGGAAYSLLEKFFKEVGKEIFGLRRRQNIFNRMNELAMRSPEYALGLKIDPFFSGTRIDSKKRALFKNVSLQNFRPSYLCRALLEGMIRELYDFYLKLRKSGLKGRELVCTGNDIKKNTFLAEICQKTFNLPMYVTMHDEEAAYGAGLLAAWGGGEYNSLEEAQSLICYRNYNKRG